MGWTAVAAELGTQAFLAGLKAAKGRVTKRQYKRLIATTVAQVLALHPDVGTKQARRRAERATGTAPSKKLIKGKQKAAAAAVIAGGAIKAVTAVRGRKRAGPPRPSGRGAPRDRQDSQPQAAEPRGPVSAEMDSPL